MPLAPIVASATDSRRLGYQPGLDGVRALAIVSVVAYHASYMRLGGLGAAGVTIFFVLSGFLITGVLLKEHADRQAISVRRFYTRRALRLFPALLVMVALTTSLSWPSDSQALLHAGRTLSYVGDWWLVFSDGLGQPLGHTWSLAVEEQFYLLWPAVLIGLLAMRGRKALAGAVTLLAATVALNGLYPWTRDAGLLFGHFAPFQAGSILVGVIMALLPLPRVRFGAPLIILAVLIVIIVSAQFPDETWHRWADFAFAGAGALLIIAGLSRGPLSIQPLPYIGRISYSWYLWHAPVLHLAVWSGPQCPMWIGIAVSIGAAMASHHLVELPILRRRDRRQTDAFNHPEASPPVRDMDPIAVPMQIRGRT
jgi:peptidoglycan/LPS O-acetylase OafA/YrhL